MVDVVERLDAVEPDSLGQFLDHDDDPIGDAICARRRRSRLIGGYRGRLEPLWTKPARGSTAPESEHGRSIVSPWR